MGDDIMDNHKRETAKLSGLYVDVENLQTDGQAMVESLIENWPDKVPTLSRLMLYVRADQVELWRLWATEPIP